MIEIEKNIEIPERIDGRKTKPYKYPFNKMEVGDSFRVEDPKSYRGLYYAAYTYGKKAGQEFIVKRLEDNSSRCWRTK